MKKIVKKSVLFAKEASINIVAIAMEKELKRLGNSPDLAILALAQVKRGALALRIVIQERTEGPKKIRLLQRNQKWRNHQLSRA